MNKILNSRNLLLTTFAVAVISTQAFAQGPDYLGHDGIRRHDSVRPNGYGPQPGQGPAFEVGEQFRRGPRRGAEGRMERFRPMNESYEAAASESVEPAPFTPYTPGEAQAPGTYSDGAEFVPYPTQAMNDQDWCDNLSRALEYTLYNATPLLHRGNYTMANQILKAGLSDANTSAYIRKNVKSAEAIRNALELTTIIENSVPLQNNAPRVIAFFLMQYYPFIINTARNYDFPRSLRGERWVEQNEEEYTSGFEQFAKDQVLMALEVMADNDNGSIHPVGNTQAFINVLIRSLQFAVADLKTSRNRYAYGCTIVYMNKLASDLSRGVFGPEYLMVRRGYQAAAYLTDGMDIGCGQAYWHR